MKKTWILLLILCGFAMAQRPYNNQRSGYAQNILWRDLHPSTQDSIRKAVADSLAALSADGVTIVNDGTFKQKVFADTTALKLASADSLGMIVVVKTSLYAGDYAYYVYADSTFQEGKFAFGASTAGKQWLRLTPYISATSPTSAPKGQMYFNTTDSSLKVYNGNNFDGIFSARDKIDNQEFINPLEIPTYDDNLSATHPSVMFFPESWNGYRYWMAFTPYPGANRENPSIVVSQDGINWKEPKGISNPIAPLDSARADNFQFQSDPDLVMFRDTLWCYYRPIYQLSPSVNTKHEAIYRRFSLDGVTWSDRQRVLQTGVDTPTDTMNQFVSPSIVNIGDSLLYMYVMSDTGTGLNDYQLIRRTSTDGLVWAADTVCDYNRTTYLGSVTWTIWHLDMQYVNGVYYMLINDLVDDYRYKFFRSTDGINFKKMRGELDLIGNGVDDGWNYRGTFLPKRGNPLSFDVWGTAVADTGGGSGIFTNNHRIVYYGDVRLQDIEKPDSLNYAAIYIDAGTDTTINITAQFTWAKIGGWEAVYNSSDWSFSGDTLYCTKGGLYKFDGNVIVTGTSGDVMQLRLQTSRAATGSRHQPTFQLNNSSYNTIPLNGIANFISGDNAVIQIRNLTNGNDPTIYNASFTLTRVDDTPKQ